MSIFVFSSCFLEQLSELHLVHDLFCAAHAHTDFALHSPFVHLQHSTWICFWSLSTTCAVFSFSLLEASVTDCCSRSPHFRISSLVRFTPISGHLSFFRSSSFFPVRHPLRMKFASGFQIRSSPASVSGNSQIDVTRHVCWASTSLI